MYSDYLKSLKLGDIKKIAEESGEKEIVAKIDADIPCVYFNIREYETILRNNKKEDDRELIALYKILSPQHRSEEHTTELQSR